MLVGRGGQLLAVNVILLSEKASEEAVPPMKGTRHTSAARHTYDCPDVLAFVVSADGPVTVFNDGKRIADLRGSDQLVPKTPERIATLLEHRREANGDAGT
jgi:DNA integrity scanning protein DisA with diadenylate cyclase activity